MKKIIITFALALCVLATSNIKSEACTKTAECYATAETATCGTLYGSYIYSHSVTEGNGYSYNCTVYNESSYHSVTCSGCGAYLRNEFRTCNIVHSHSRCLLSQRGLCQQ